MKRFLIVPLFACCLLLSCAKKEVVAPTPSGVEYYPATTNKFVVYEIDSVVYTEIPQDTIHYRYQIKEKMSEEFSDNEGKPARKMERFIKKYDPAKSYDQIPWTIKEVWMLNVNANTVQLVENNVRYTKLAFPVKADFSWIGNPYNEQPTMTFRYEYIDVNEKINQTTFENVLKVQEIEEVNLISHRRYYEKYAKNVGLVQRIIEDIQSNNIVAGKPVTDRIEKGIMYSQNYVTHGID